MCKFHIFFYVILLNIIYLYIPVFGKLEDHEIPPGISIVSRFIKDFHKKLEDDSYPNVKSETSVQTLIDLPFYNKADMPDKNVTSLVRCNNKPAGLLSVEVVNSTRLSSLLASDPNVTTRLVEGPCLALLFFSPSCPFSCLAAPHFNALPRAFPTMKIAAINAIQHQAFNTQFGIAGVPTIMLFHNGKAAAKFNDSDYTLEMFTKFLTRTTGIKAEEKMFVTSSDFGGPVPTVLVKETDYVLGLAWAVIILALGYGVTRLERWHAFVESVATVWREANHEHTD